jgi:hypothetical protein
MTAAFLASPPQSLDLDYLRDSGPGSIVDEDVQDILARNLELSI